ncbi:Na+/H+-dicarboxylate symporter [Butyrivibrio sp. ob235]|uniref:dicarboxylate/amino acid:cation symporter n=1 Tax=unclassified Butyrivibrio TaxID=2639466 RepID=UPI0003B52FC6|nr:MULTISPECIES: dicarboxylate/amino acid:cation symporter [unclassified Butyrivibrio]SEL90866.1 Na+/H+-dicarboxylate symporter [Butyrivibrio sp. ob235]
MRYINAKKRFMVSDEDCISRSIQFAEESLKSIGLNKKLVIKAILVAEETIAQLIKKMPPNGTFTVCVRKILGETEVVIRARGPEYNPDTTTADGVDNLERLEDEDAQDAIRAILLKAHGEDFKVSYKNGVNKIRILASGAESSMLINTMIGLVLGLIFGVLLQMVIPPQIAGGISKYALDPIKTVFMNCLKMIIAPVVFFSIVSCVSQFKDLSQLGRIGGKVMGVYMLTTVLAVLLSLGISMLIHPGNFGFALSLSEAAADVSVDTNVDTSILHTIIGIFPSNFVQPFVDSDTLKIIFLAFICGIAVGMIGEYSAFLKNFFDACNSLFLTITTLVTKIIPVAVFCSVALMVKDMGGASILSVLGFAGTVLFSMFCMMLVYGVLIAIIGRLNPIHFYKKNREGMLTSFTLASSNAAMPTNMRTCTDKLGISPRVCSFSIPLGATVNMDGTCIFLTAAGLFLARAYGISIPPSAYLSLIITIILLSLGCPGVPGAAIVCVGIVLVQIGVPIESVGLIIGIHPIIDMFETMSNTTGDVAAALIVAKTEGLLDVDLYKS